MNNTIPPTRLWGCLSDTRILTLKGYCQEGCRTMKCPSDSSLVLQIAGLLFFFFLRLSNFPVFVCVYVHVYTLFIPTLSKHFIFNLYIYIYIYTHTHTHICFFFFFIHSSSRDVYVFPYLGYNVAVKWCVDIFSRY